MLENKNILITGGTGSFGHAFVPMTLEKYKPNKIVLMVVSSYLALQFHNFLYPEKIMFYKYLKIIKRNLFVELDSFKLVQIKPVN